MRLLILLLLFSLSFSQHVKVLYSNGKVEVVDTRKTPLSVLRARPDVIYVEPPIKLKLLDTIAYSSSVVIRGSGNYSFSINTQSGQRLSILVGGASVSFSGSCSGSSIDNLTCTNGTLNLSVYSSSDWRLIVQSFGRNLQLSDFSTTAYYIGTGAASTGKTGRNVIIGIIDTGIDWCHPAFRRSDGSSKVLYFYEPATNTEYTKTQIEQFINQGRCNEDYHGHGTHVAGIASYIAPDADLIVVRTNLYDTDIIRGLEYLKNKKNALGRPMVVNMSLGGHFGPHDGTSMLERAIANLSGNGFVVVAAAGNEGNKKLHAVISGISSTVSVRLNSPDNVIDGWYKNGTLRVEFCDSSNRCLSAEPGASASGNLSGGCRVDIDNTATSHPLNGDGRFVVEFKCSGNFTIKLTPRSGTPNADLYLAYENGEFMDCFLDDGFGGFLGTVGEPATSPYVIAVGALTSRFVSDDPKSFIDLGKIAYFSSRGPTRDGRLKPEVVAPGYYVLGPKTGTSDYIPLPGTSMASPVVAGLVALILEENPNLDVNGVRGILSSQALSDGFTGSLPNNIYGYGKAFLSSFSSVGSVGSIYIGSLENFTCGLRGSVGGGAGGGGGSGGTGGGGGGGGCNSASPDLYTALLALLSVVVLRRLAKGKLA
jgi:subtilisin family serine protease